MVAVSGAGAEPGLRVVPGSGRVSRSCPVLSRVQSAEGQSTEHTASIQSTAVSRTAAPPSLSLQYHDTAASAHMTKEWVCRGVKGAKSSEGSQVK